MRVAIAENEQEPGYVHNLTEAMRCRTLAMCRWLASDVHDADIHNQVVAFLDAYYSAQERVDKQLPDIALPNYINAQDYESTVALYERSGRTPPRTARRAIREGCVCYVIARHHLGVGYPKEDVDASIGALLRRNVGDQWLAKGHYFNTAIWTKIVYWNPGMSAAGAVMRCYDCMPGVERPTAA